MGINNPAICSNLTHFKYLIDIQRSIEIFTIHRKNKKNRFYLSSLQLWFWLIHESTQGNLQNLNLRSEQKGTFVFKIRLAKTKFRWEAENFFLWFLHTFATPNQRNRKSLNMRMLISTINCFFKEIQIGNNQDYLLLDLVSYVHHTNLHQ